MSPLGKIGKLLSAFSQQNQPTGKHLLHATTWDFGEYKLKKPSLYYKHKTFMRTLCLHKKDQPHSHSSSTPIQEIKIIITSHDRTLIKVKCIQNNWEGEKKKLKPEKSSQTGSTGAPGKYLPTSTTVVTPLASASLLALNKASLLSSTDSSGIQGRRSFIAESTSKPVGSAHKDNQII